MTRPRPPHSIAPRTHSLSTQLSLGLVAPLIVQASIEAGLFRRHQEERAAAGLPLECCREACAYEAIDGLAEALDFASATAAGWVLAGILWEVAVLLAAGRLTRA